MYEGAPELSRQDRFWDIIERHKVNILYTAPTAIRAFIRGATSSRTPRSLEPAPARHRRRADQPRSLDVVSTRHRQRALPDRRYLVADRDRRDHDHAAARRDPDQARLRDAAAPRHRRRDRRQAGQPRRGQRGGFLVISSPGRRCCARIYGDPERYQAELLERRWRRNCYFTGDGARRDEDGYFWIMGRVDDVINVAGHRLGTMEVESALVEPSAGRRGGGGRAAATSSRARRSSAFVTLQAGSAAEHRSCKNELQAHVAKEIGASHARTRSASPTRCRRRARQDHAPAAARDRATGSVKGDMTTLEDFSVMARLREDEEE